MTRALFLLALLLAASDARADTTPGMLLPGAMPSLSQGRGQARFTPAPMPNPEISAPRIKRDPNEVQVAPGLTKMRTGQSLGGDGFARGSAYSGDLEHRGRGGLGSSLAPSLKLKMPVDVGFR